MRNQNQWVRNLEMHRSREDYDYERLLKRHKEERMRDRYESGRDSRYDQEYTSICLNGLHPTVPLTILKDEIYRQFNKFGDLSVRVVNNPDNRIAFCNFYESEAAREAKRARKNLILFDLPVHIEAVYNRRPRSPSPNGYSRQGYNSRTSPSSGHHTQDGYGESYADSYYEEHKRGRDHHKFPYHLNHVQPEDDPNANRTLFVGNIDVDITEADIRSIFERYGVIEEIDIKRPQKQGIGNAYAFIKYYNVDMAHRAKVDMSGRYIGRYQCKIGYGKPTSTNCLWIGGLGPWVRADVLEQEFDRFGVINRIEWPHGKGYAYVLFDSVDAAQAANTAMRGAALGGPDHRIRVDYADESHMPSHSKSPRQSSVCDDSKKSERIYQDFPDSRKHRDDYRDRPRSEREYNPSNDGRNPDNSEMERYRKDDYDRMNSVSSDRRRQTSKYDEERTYRNYPVVHSSKDYVPNREREIDREVSRYSPEVKRRRTVSPGSIRSRDDRDRLSESEHRDRKRTSSTGLSLANVETCNSVEELSKCLHVVWKGALVLKNSAFAARMHLVSGDVHLVDTLMRDTSSTEMPVLKITQRLRLDLPKLEEVGKRVSTSGTNGHAILLAMPGSPDAVEESNSSVQQRPLRNLISYLKQKEAAGVISLPPNPGKDKDNIGVLHAFPPCTFGNEYLIKRAPKLTCDLSKDDHLVIIVVRGAV